jgi:tRNA pseudouridine38-40 synthase
LKTFKLTLEYDGSRYSGSQEQINARTIMGELRKAAEDYLRGRVDLQAAGRTDAGVHALAQVAHLRVPPHSRHSPEAILRELNERLPADIAVLAVAPVPPGFHARHDALARRYSYRIATRKTAFDKRFVWWIKAPLEVPLMARAARMIEGRHDFTCFRAEDQTRPGDSAVVVVNAASFELAPTGGAVLEFRIEASHFLWRMVRRLVGVLVKLGLGELTFDDYRCLLDARPAAHLDVPAWTAPSSGLFLEAVIYPDASPQRQRSR